MTSLRDRRRDGPVVAEHPSTAGTGEPPRLVWRPDDTDPGWFHTAEWELTFAGPSAPEPLPARAGLEIHELELDEPQPSAPSSAGSTTSVPGSVPGSAYPRRRDLRRAEQASAALPRRREVHRAPAPASRGAHGGAGLPPTARVAARVGVVSVLVAMSAAAVTGHTGSLLWLEDGTAVSTEDAAAALTLAPLPGAVAQPVPTVNLWDFESDATRLDLATARLVAARKAAAEKAAAEKKAAEERKRAAEAAAKVRAEAKARAIRNVQRDPKAIAQIMVAERGWNSTQWRCLDLLWTRESRWRWNASNPSSGAYGIPQALPGGKMASAGSDWRTNPVTQIEWGLSYIADRYGTPCAAWNHSEAVGWY